MKKIITAVLLSFLGPGLGQIYNRDYKKGSILLSLSAVLFFVPLFWIVKRVAPLLPDPSQGPIQTDQVQSLVLQAAGGYQHVLSLITFLFLGIWAYAITQAYFKASEISKKESLQQ